MEFDLNLPWAGDVDMVPEQPALNINDVDKVVHVDDDSVEEVLAVVDLEEDGNLITSILEECDGGGSGSGRTLPEDSDKPEVPTEGMEFSTGEEFVAYIHRYAFTKGFQARIRSSEKENDDCGNKRDYVPPVAGSGGMLLETNYLKSWKIRMICQKHGSFTSRAKNPNRSTRSCKTGCMFGVNARKNPDTGWWRISKVADLHNHDFVPTGSRHLPRYRVIGLLDKELIIKLSKAGVRVPHIYNVFVNQYKGYSKVPFTELDMRNFIALHVKKPPLKGDFVAMLEIFKKIQEKSPNFFYEYDVDKQTNTMKSVFWAASRCREAFKEFGDIVCFDTTFLKNRYKLPFALFVAVNHYGKSILVGCALLQKEDVETFVWLFRTWRKCMGNDPLKMLTDQCPKIAKARTIVFPNTRQRLCIWHIRKNARRHLGMLSVWPDLSKDMQSILHDSFTIPEFERRWMEMVAKHQVEKNDWLKDMYQIRDKWVPVFFKSEFWAGMSSTQRSEGMNNFIKDYVNVDTLLTVFAEKYGEAVCKRIAAENDDIIKDSDRRCRITKEHPFEDACERMLTHDKFQEFLQELAQMRYNSATKGADDQNTVEYDVIVKHFRVGWTTRKNFTVRLDRNTLDIKCDCKNFEFRGMLCAHALRVFWEEEITDVPEKYILERWRKNIPRKYLKEDYPEIILTSKASVISQRHETMHSVCEDICVMVMSNESLYKESLETLKKMRSDLKAKTDTPDGLSIEFLEGIGRVYRRTKPDEDESVNEQGVVIHKKFTTLDGHTDSVSCMAKNTNHLKWLFSASMDGDIRLWDLATRRTVCQFPGHQGAVRGLTASTNGRVLVSCGMDSTVRLWNVPEVSDAATDASCTDYTIPLAVYAWKNAFCAVDHKWDDNRFATAGAHDDIWDHNRSHPVHTYEWGSDTVISVRFNPGEPNILATSGSDRSITLYDLRMSTPVTKLVMRTKTNSIAWNPMEPMNFTAANEDCNCYSFDHRNLDAAKHVHQDHVSAVMDIDYSPNGREFVTGSYDKTVRIFQYNGGHSREMCQTKRMQRVFCVKFSGDASYVISGSDDFNLRLWKPKASQQLGVEEDGNMIKDPIDKRGRGRGQTKRKESWLPLRSEVEAGVEGEEKNPFRPRQTTRHLMSQVQAAWMEVEVSRMHFKRSLVTEQPSPYFQMRVGFELRVLRDVVMLLCTLTLGNFVKSSFNYDSFYLS